MILLRLIIVLSTVLILCVALEAAPLWAFRITAPDSDAILKSGQTVTVGIDLGKETGITLVRYFWYRQGQEPEPIQVARAALVAGPASVPPFGGQLTVPADGLGEMRLLAVADVARGRLAGHEEFDEILLQVQPDATLVSIDFDVEKPLRLDLIGKMADLPVVGLFSDQVVRRLAGASTGSSYLSSNEKVVQVMSDGAVRVVGNGKATITVTNRGKGASLDVVVKAPIESNNSPVADAGGDQRVKGGATVVLNGLGSHDADGDPLRYEWAQLSGQKVSLLGADSPKPTFVAPKVSGKRVLRFKLRVTDMRGPDTVKGADSLPSYVNISVEP
jgi:hypothetical protein